MSELVELTKKWYRYVATNHHKDRDCHWYIETDYAYDREPTHQAQHYGYVWSEVVEKPLRQTYAEAEADLLDMIKQAIESQRTWVDSVLSGPASDWDEEQRNQAKLYMELFT